MIWSTRAKMRTIKQAYNVIEWFNLRFDAKQFTHKMMQKNNIMSILRRCKKIHHFKSPVVNSAIRVINIVLGRTK